MAAPAEAGEREHFSEHHHSSASVVAYARALGPTDGFSVTTFDRSPSYLSSRRAAAAVARLAPSARAVIAVCDPTPRLWAFYHHARSFRANGSTTSAAEAAAAAAAAAAAGGEGVSPRSVADFAAPLFDLPWPEFVETIRTQPLAHGGLFESGQYERQEQLWAAALGPARVHLWHRDAYAADPGPATRALLRFLGLPPARGVDLDGGGGGEPGAARLPEVDAPPPGLPPMGEAERAAVEPHYAASWKGVTERLLARGGG